MRFPVIALCLIIPMIFQCSGTEQKDELLNESTVIAFGSCSRQNISNQRWNEVLRHSPVVWIWLGDNIYGDTHDMRVMKEKYDRQKSYPGYQELLKSATEIIGTWDDHDFGVNDGGKYYTKKEESKKLSLAFLDVPDDNPVWDHPGIYQSYQYDLNGYLLKVILLDTRYFRDTIYKDSATRAYLPNQTGDILGEDQWAWLEEELKRSEANLNIIGSGIQVIPEDHAYEKWANFPLARKRLFDLLLKYPDKKTMLISGDRHIAEISRINLEGLHYPLYDFTSSGLTHSWQNANVEKNRHRVSDFIKDLNFGLIIIKREENGNYAVHFEVRGTGDNLLYECKTAL